VTPAARATAAGRAFDPAALRRDFPIFARRVNGKPLVYLDSASSSQRPAVVLEALDRFYRTSNANVHRGVHTLSQEATAQMEETRAKVARFIGADDPATVVFTRNTTESINLVAHAWGRKNLRPGDEILLTEMEHHSNLVPWQLLAAAVGAKLRFIPVTKPQGELDLSGLPSLLTAKTRLLAVTHMSNVLGTINPVAELARKAHDAGALVLVDGAQSVPHLPTDVKALGCDFLAFSAHKMLGPTGVGVLWGRRELLEAMDPFLGGGDMIRTVTLESSTWNELPYKFEAGTPNYADIAAFGPALDYIESVGRDALREHEIALTGYALKALADAFPGIQLYGPTDMARRGGVVSFNLPGAHPHDVGTILDREGVAVRAGHHCCQPLMKKFDVAGTARASFYLYNDTADVDALVSGLRQVEKVFGRGR
jgi:cysteine desulfurase/selenocysteine lyase